MTCTGWAFALLSVSVSCIVYHVHTKQLQAVHSARQASGLEYEALATLRHQRRFTLRIINIAPIFGVASFIPLFFPRASGLFALAKIVAEALSIASFLGLCVSWFGGPGKMVSLLASGTPRKYLATPPLGCLCRCWMRERVMDRGLLQYCHRATMQYLIIVPVCAYIALWSELESTSYQDFNSNFDVVLGVIKMISVTIAMQGGSVLLSWRRV